MRKLISIVIPAYNEADNIPNILNKIRTVFQNLDYRYEVILVDDGSKDNTLDTIKSQALTDERIFFLEFSKNFGHQLAVKAGMDYAFGDCVISMDCDQQHPPELIPAMLEKWEAGYDVVYTVRGEDEKLSRSKRNSSSSFYKVLYHTTQILDNCINV